MSEFIGQRGVSSVMETYCGIAFDLANPGPEMVCIEDIVTALSREGRYANHTRMPWSVLSHEVLVAMLVARRVDDPIAVAVALHHDDSEAYTGDIHRPLKALLGEVFKQIEANVQAAIHEHFGLPWPVPEHIAAEVKRADNIACRAEARIFMRSRGKAWHWGDVPEIELDELHESTETVRIWRQINADPGAYLQFCSGQQIGALLKEVE